MHRVCATRAKSKGRGSEGVMRASECLGEGVIRS